MNLSARNQKILAGLVATVLPVGYLVGLHIKWMQDTRQRIRMAVKHLGFWGGMTAGLVGLHKLIIRKRNSLGKDIGIALGLSLLPILGYEISRRLAKKYFPSIQPPGMPMHDPMEQMMPTRPSFELPQPEPEPFKSPETTQLAYNPYASQPATYGYAYGSPYQTGYSSPYNNYSYGYTAHWNPYSYPAMR